jgi:hypothetical protein
VTAIGLGDDFTIALGLTMPTNNILKLANSRHGMRKDKETSKEAKFQINLLQRLSPSRHSFNSDLFKHHRSESANSNNGTLVSAHRHRTSKVQDENTPLRKWSREKPS